MRLLLKRWIEKLRVAVWLHPEIDLGRRALLFGATALVAATAMNLPTLIEEPVYGVLANRAAIASELNDVVRRAFMPRLYVQLWRSAPLMSALLEA